MSDHVLYRRTLPHGPAVRIRRTSDDGDVPVILVLEVDRRAGTPRAEDGEPPTLMRCESTTEGEGVATLEPHARDDRRIVQLMRERGLR